MVNIEFGHLILLNKDGIYGSGEKSTDLVLSQLSQLMYLLVEMET